MNDDALENQEVPAGLSSRSWVPITADAGIAVLREDAYFIRGALKVRRNGVWKTVFLTEETDGRGFKSPR
jgi:hypothetical protein